MNKRKQIEQAAGELMEDIRANGLPAYPRAIGDLRAMQDYPAIRRDWEGVKAEVRHQLGTYRH